jgi:hypothetical protein
MHQLLTLNINCVTLTIHIKFVFKNLIIYIKKIIDFFVSSFENFVVFELRNFEFRVSKLFYFVSIISFRFVRLSKFRISCFEFLKKNFEHPCLKTGPAPGSKDYLCLLPKLDY